MTVDLALILQMNSTFDSFSEAHVLKAQLLLVDSEDCLISVLQIPGMKSEVFLFSLASMLRLLTYFR